MRAAERFQTNSGEFNRIIFRGPRTGVYLLFRARGTRDNLHRFVTMKSPACPSNNPRRLSAKRPDSNPLKAQDNGTVTPTPVSSFVADLPTGPCTPSWRGGHRALARERIWSRVRGVRASRPPCGRRRSLWRWRQRGQERCRQQHHHQQSVVPADVVIAGVEAPTGQRRRSHVWSKCPLLLRNIKHVRLFSSVRELFS